MVANSTLLWYPGGKFRAREQISMYFPRDIDRLVSPFFGGGAIEIFMAQEEGTEIQGYDLSPVVANFWFWALNTPRILARKIQRYYPMDKAKFADAWAEFDAVDDYSLEAAVLYFVLNRCSYSGAMTHYAKSIGGKDGLTQSKIDTVRTFNPGGVQVYPYSMDYRASIAAHPDEFLYLDPPYHSDQNTAYKAYDSFYGVGIFDHEAFADFMHQIPNRWAMSYQGTDFVKHAYKDYDIIDLVPWTYGMGTSNRGKEILIKNY